MSIHNLKNKKYQKYKIRKKKFNLLTTKYEKIV